MHVHFEQLVVTRSDCTIQTLSWMGKVPDGAPDEDGWKLNRQHYYQEGWLSMGNVKGIVSATFTTCHCKPVFDLPPRTNFNLRGHKNEVSVCVYVCVVSLHFSHRPGQVRSGHVRPGQVRSG